jgi:hypothetical protein
VAVQEDRDAAAVALDKTLLGPPVARLNPRGELLRPFADVVGCPLAGQNARILPQPPGGRSLAPQTPTWSGSPSTEEP